jgi:hypothetical protein
MQYKLKWLGYPASHDSWEYAEDLTCDDLIAEFENALAKKTAKKTAKVVKKKETIDKAEKAKRAPRRRESIVPTSRRREATVTTLEAETPKSSSVRKVAKKEKVTRKAVKEMPQQTVKASSIPNTPDFQVVVHRVKSPFEGFIPEKIVGFTEIDGEKVFLVKWTDNARPNSLIPSVVARQKCPLLIINYYEENLKIYEGDEIEAVDAEMPEEAADEDLDVTQIANVEENETTKEDTNMVLGL